MKKKLKKAVRESFNFPEPARKADFLGKYGTPPVVEDRRGRFAPIVFKASAVAAACALAVGLWSVGKTPGVDRETPDESGLISASEGYSEPATAPVIVTTAVPDGESVIVTTAAPSESPNVVTTLAVSEKPASASTAAAVTAARPNNIAPAVTVPKTTNASSGTVVTAAVKPADKPETDVGKIDEPNQISIEREICMKKLNAFLASIGVTAASLAGTANAAYEIGTPPIPVNTFYYRDGAVDAISKGDFDIDINADGKFDIFDCYAFYRSIHKDGGAPEEMVKKVSEGGDYTNDGVVNITDFNRLVDYYAINCDVNLDLYDIKYYIKKCPDVYADDADTWACRFFVNLQEEFSAVRADYKLMKRYFDNGIIDLDVDNDGELTIKDIHELHVYLFNEAGGFTEVAEYKEGDDSQYSIMQTTYTRYDKMVTLPALDTAKCARVVWDVENLMEKGKVYPDASRILYEYNGGNLKDYYDDIISEDVSFEYWMRERNSSYAYTKLRNEEFFDVICGKFMDYVMNYYFSTNEALPEYYAVQVDENGGVHNSYFDGYYPNSRYYETGICIRNFLFYTGGYASLLRIDKDKLCDEFEKYLADSKDGGFSVLDMDGNGEVNYLDEWLIRDYIDYSYVYPEDGDVIEDGAREIIENNFDLNGDGESGDIYDLLIAEAYFDLDRYNNAQKERESITSLTLTDDSGTIEVPVVNGNVVDENGNIIKDMETFEKEWFERSVKGEAVVEYKTEPASDPDPETKIAPSPAPRSGDASGDGELKMNDAVLIMQSISNPDKYELDDQQSYDADVHNTGDGVTTMDALKVQKTLLGLE